MEFKGTKGELELKFAGTICIGIGTKGNYSQITANSILPETDKEYKKEKEEIEANMKLYAAAPELLEALKFALEGMELADEVEFSEEIFSAKKAIEKALK